MSFSDDSMVMPVAPAYGNNGGLGGWGSDIWLILIVLLAFGGFGGYGMNGFGNGALGYDFPWLLNGQNAINANTNAGFQSAAVQSAIGDLSTAVTAGFGNVQNSLCSGFAGVNATVTGAQNAIAQQLYGNQIADLERSFAAQTAVTQGINNVQGQLAQCCCDNRLATNDVKYTIATEACANRTNDTQNTQAILNAVNAGVQSIKDQMCNDKIDAKNEKIVELQNQLNMASLRESQTAQNALIQQGFSNEVDQLYNRLNTCPVPTTPVYGRTPIFTCGNGGYAGCGCGM